MLGFRQKVADDTSAKVHEQDEEETVVVPFPKSAIPERSVSEDGQRSYEEVAEKLGFEPEALTRARLISLFHKHGIELYDYGEVDAYMRAKVEDDENAECWWWRPLRDKDVPRFGWDYNPQWRNAINGFYSEDCVDCRPYDRLVPLEVLDKIALIEEHFGDKVRFFVSDYGVPRPDPFIGVHSSREGDESVKTQMLIFDVWDEPGFSKNK